MLLAFKKSGISTCGIERAREKEGEKERVCVCVLPVFGDSVTGCCACQRTGLEWTGLDWTESR